MVRRKKTDFDQHGYKPSKVVFDPEALSSDQRLGAFEEFAFGNTTGFNGQSRLLSLSPSNANYVRDQRYSFEDIRTSQLTTSGYVARASDSPKSDPRKYLYVSHCLSGGAMLETSKRETKIAEGDISINLSKNYRLEFQAGNYSRVRFPKRIIRCLDIVKDEYIVLHRHDPTTQILRDTIKGVVDGLQSRNLIQAKLTRDLMLTISQQILESILTTRHDTSHNHLRDRAMTYIKENLHRADLAVPEIARYVNASRATLYRAFENIGGIKEFITNERLALAQSMLCDGRTDRGYVATVAYETGFSAPEQFSKVFKSRTGLSPKQFVECGSD